MNLYHAPPPPNVGTSTGSGGGSHLVIILAILFCVLMCALGINSVVRCIVWCFRRISLGGAGELPAIFIRKGLKKAALRQIPVAVYGSDGGVAYTECPICLGEFLEGEKIRALPKCHHCFHVRCVDIWLGSHSTCPTCRRSLVEEASESGGGSVEVAASSVEEV